MYQIQTPSLFLSPSVAHTHTLAHTHTHTHTYSLSLSERDWTFHPFSNPSFFSHYFRLSVTLEGSLADDFQRVHRTDIVLTDGICTIVAGYKIKLGFGTFAAHGHLSASARTKRPRQRSVRGMRASAGAEHSEDSAAGQEVSVMQSITELRKKHTPKIACHSEFKSNGVTRLTRPLPHSLLPSSGS